MAKICFISQPMSGKSIEEIATERNAIKEQMNKMFGDCVFLHSFFSDFNGSPIEFLARGLDVMAKADVVVFAKGWEAAIGCRIEHAVAEEYGLTIFEIS